MNSAEASRPDSVFALIVAAGRGSRMGSDVPKQYLSLQGQSVLSRSVQRLQSSEHVGHVVVVLNHDDTQWASQPCANDSAVSQTIGGATRAHSVLCGLRSIIDNGGAGQWVLVHDAARPLVRPGDIDTLIERVHLAQACGGILAVPETDTLKQSGAQYLVERSLDRSTLWHAQTPQYFQVSQLHDAIEKALRTGNQLTDESSAMEALGLQPLIVEGHTDNIKLTHTRDVALAGILLQLQEEETAPIKGKPVESGQ